MLVSCRICQQKRLAQPVDFHLISALTVRSDIELSSRGRYIRLRIPR
jgi:hypothetical protein